MNEQRLGEIAFDLRDGIVLPHPTITEFIAEIRKGWLMRSALKQIAVVSRDESDVKLALDKIDVIVKEALKEK